MDEFPVKVYIYDLSKGLARSLSMPLLGKQIDGIWHTGIVVYGQEFYFGGMGIESVEPCGTVLGQPDSIVDLGVTQVPFDMMMEYLSELSSTTYKPESYHLLEHNCNTFSNEIANFLTGNNIPAFVTNLPQEVLSTPFGSMIRPFIDSMSVRPTGGHSVFPVNASGASALPTRTETPVVKNTNTNAAVPQQITFTPIKFNDKQVSQRFDQVKSKLTGNCSNEDMKLIEETAEFVCLPANKCTWSIGPDHLQALARVISSLDHGDDERCGVAGLLQLAMLSPDVIGLTTHDRCHTIMLLLHNMLHVDHSNSLRIIITKMMVNTSSNTDGLQWMMSDEKWTKDKDTHCNMSITMNNCLSSLLSDNVGVRNAAVTLAANFSQHKNLNEECSIELGSALIECLRKSEDRVTQERSLAALSRCVQVSPEVAALVKVMAVDLDAYEKMSELAKSYTDSIRQASQSLPI